MAFIRLFLLSLAFLLWCHDGWAQIITLTIKGYDMHTELNWMQVSSADRYQLWRKEQGETNYSLLTSTKKLRWNDWIGRESDQPESFDYYVEALTLTGQVLATSDSLSASVAPFSDEQFLDMVQEYTFRYFYEYGHPTSGMARERLGSGDIVTSGGTGFGIMALIVGVNRGYITREEGVNRLLKIVSFLQFADRFHGVFPHWLNGKTGDVVPFGTFDDGGDLVETAFLMEGLLCARQFFIENTPEEETLREVITDLWEDVEWDFYSRNHSGVLYWHWSPNYSWQMNFPIRGYNEALIVYLLAIASPTHPVDASYYHEGWAGSNYISGHTWYGIKLFVGPPMGGPLFFAHYSFMGFDPRNIKDAYTNYFEQNTNHTLINRSWCIDNPFNHEGYSDVCWGLTASDDPWGYLAHAPAGSSDNGTITPAAAIPSIPYTPAESMAALKHFYREHGPDLWGEYGFYDAFNLKSDWFADSYIAIDQGPIINMIENYRSGLLWEAFMANPEIAPALEAIGFVQDPVSTHESSAEVFDWKVYPTITDGELYVSLPAAIKNGSYQLSVCDISGRKFPFRQIEVNNEITRIQFPQNIGFHGWLWLSIITENKVIQTSSFWLH
jgi:hypothetical protein